MQRIEVKMDNELTGPLEQEETILFFPYEIEEI
jgi:hypothetical protein